MIYNDSFMDNSTNILQLINGIGVASGTGYLFGYLILLGFFIIYLSVFYRTNFLQTLVVDGMICTLLSILLFVSGLVPATIIAICFVVFIISLIFYLFS